MKNKKILTLLVDDDTSNLDLYGLSIENCHEDIECHFASSAEMAMEKISTNNYKFIVCDYNMPNGNGDIVYKKIRQTNSNIPFLLFSTLSIEEIDYFNSVNLNDNKLFSLTKPCASKVFKKELITLLLSNNIIQEELISNYYKVKTIYFLRYNKTLFDIYIKLSSSKYVKIIHKNSSYTLRDIERYLDKKQDYLYINTNDAEHFESKLMENTYLIEEESELEDSDDALEKTMTIVHYLVKELGINERVITLVDRSIDVMKKELKKDNKLLEILSKFREQHNYLHEHCYILGYFCDLLCTEMDWSATDIKKKLYYASIFHDVTLTDNNIVTALELRKENEEDQDPLLLKAYKNHPIEVAQMIRNQTSIPANVDKIIENQHELPNCTGFPRKLSSQSISQLEALFNLSYAFVIELYRNDFQKNEFTRIVKYLEINYSKGNYKKPLEALKRLVSKLDN